MKTQREVVELYKQLFGSATETEDSVTIAICGVTLNLPKTITGSGTILNSRNISFRN